MGVSGIWQLLAACGVQKSVTELRGQRVAIDLAGWVCESMSVNCVEGPNLHVRNLFFRACYLLLNDITPVFVLEGAIPVLKTQTLLNRGIKNPIRDNKRRKYFDRILQECSNMLAAMGIDCVKAPGEGEAYCSYLNSIGMVDAIISQDSDCFAYGARRVLKNFKVSANGGTLDVFDIKDINDYLPDTGQNKFVAMALLCGCDYFVGGVPGVGIESLTRLFKSHQDNDILETLRQWRSDDRKYATMRAQLDDPLVCSNCFHSGRVRSHQKIGCGICNTTRGCTQDPIRSEKRLNTKAELTIRDKALLVEDFPNNLIIEEFLKRPDSPPNMRMQWNQPNIVKFLKIMPKLLQWSELYSFQKILPFVTRWLMRFGPNENVPFEPAELLKRRTVKGVPSVEVLWQDKASLLGTAVPSTQIEDYLMDSETATARQLLTTVEPVELLQKAYPVMWTAFDVPKKAAAPPRKARPKKAAAAKGGESLADWGGLKEATEEIAASVEPKKPKAKTKSSAGGKAMKQLKLNDMKVARPQVPQTDQMPRAVAQHMHSTPVRKSVPSDLDSDDEGVFDVSAYLNRVIGGGGSAALPASDLLRAHVWNDNEAAVYSCGEGGNVAESAQDGGEPYEVAVSKSPSPVGHMGDMEYPGGDASMCIFNSFRNLSIAQTTPSRPLRSSLANHCVRATNTPVMGGGGIPFRNQTAQGSSTPLAIIAKAQRDESLTFPVEHMEADGSFFFADALHEDGFESMVLDCTAPILID